TIMSLVNTKFHHYILPALPALAILAAVLLDDLLAAPERIHRLGLLLLAAPTTLLCGRDLAAFPPRILWLFHYDYVNAPGTGRPWPLVNLYGDRYEYGAQLMVFAVAAAVATLLLGLVNGSTQDRVGATSSQGGSNRSALAVGGAFLLALILSIAAGPATPSGAA